MQRGLHFVGGVLPQSARHSGSARRACFRHGRLHEGCSTITHGADGTGAAIFVFSAHERQKSQIYDISIYEASSAGDLVVPENARGLEKCFCRYADYVPRSRTSSEWMSVDPASIIAFVAGSQASPLLDRRHYRRKTPPERRCSLRVCLMLVLASAEMLIKDFQLHEKSETSRSGLCDDVVVR